MELALGILGLALAVVSLPWLKPGVENAVRAIRRRWRLRPVPSELQACLQIRSGVATSVSDAWLICDWSHLVKFRSNSLAEQIFDIVLVNTSNEPHPEKTFPIYRSYCDKCGPIPLQPSSCWYKVGRATYEWSLEDVSPDSDAAVIRMRFPEPVLPGEDVRIRWGYQAISHYHEGHNWFEWYFAHPQGRYYINLDFDGEWVVTDVRPRVNAEVSLPEPRVSRNAMKWTIRGPKPGAKYRVDFELRRP